jgi:hypothetical protein
MTPQAGRGPALPVFLDSSWPPLPRSSVPAWTTIVRCLCVSFRYGRRIKKKTYANNALSANQLDQLISVASLGVALTISLEVAQVTNVALLILGRTVGLVLGVDYSALAAAPNPPQISLQLTMRTSRRAAIGVITESVNVHAALSVGVVTSNVP